MTQVFKDSGNVRVGDVLAFVDRAVSAGDTAAVPVSCLPLLRCAAGCQPCRSGEGKGVYLFSPHACATARCGIFERFLAALSLLVISPLLITIAGAIWLADGSPVFFRQVRYGRNSLPFSLFKYRTMLRHSEKLHAKLQLKKCEDGRLFKLERDPRVTRLGGFLRRTFLDELPQLLNIVRGEMRFVGPRPLPSSDWGHYTQPFHRLRLMGLPGMTGLWQVSGRNERTFDEMCLLDVYYLCNRSAALDTRIMWRTVRLLFKQIGLKREA